jgi:hypothetical protein
MDWKNKAQVFQALENGAVRAMLRAAQSRRMI